jgi:hypothetical protein
MSVPNDLNIRLYCDNKSGGYISYGSKDKIDLTPYDEIKITWQHISITHRRQDMSYFGLVDKREDVNIEGLVENKHIKNKNKNFGIRTDIMDISDVNEEKYIGFGAQVLSDKDEWIELSVYEISLYSDGEKKVSYK